MFIGRGAEHREREKRKRPEKEKRREKREKKKKKNDEEKIRKVAWLNLPLELLEELLLGDSKPPADEGGDSSQFLRTIANLGNRSVERLICGMKQLVLFEMLLNDSQGLLEQLDKARVLHFAAASATSVSLKAAASKAEDENLALLKA